MGTNNAAREALDTAIHKSRVYLHKPIQIAEILFRHRTEKGWNLSDLESCRNISKSWHDDVSTLLDEHNGTSSQRYAGNRFESNVISTKFLAQLGAINKRDTGLVEAYIYKALETRLSSTHEVYKYLRSSTADSFSLETLVSFFQNRRELRRNTGKLYEIVVYALITTIIRALKAQIALKIRSKDKAILKDFERCIKMVLGIDSEQSKFIFPTTPYRSGRTNDTGNVLDMWANYGQAIQVKYLTLSKELAEDAADKLTTKKIIIVCLDTERKAIESLFRQISFGETLQGIITIDSLDNWYKLCLTKKHRGNFGLNLLRDLRRKFVEEFPPNKTIVPLMKKRGYDKIAMPNNWNTWA